MCCLFHPFHIWVPFNDAQNHGVPNMASFRFGSLHLDIVLFITLGECQMST